MEAFEQLIEQIAPNLYAYRDRFFTSFAATFEMFAKAGIIAFVVGLFFGVLLVITRKGGVRQNLVVYQIVNIVINVFRSIPFIILLIFLIPLTRAVVGSAIGVGLLCFAAGCLFAWKAQVQHRELEEAAAADAARSKKRRKKGRR